MSQDIANLSFNIDSSSVGHANQQLMLLGERSTFAADHAQSLTRVWNEAGAGLMSFTGSMQSFNQTLQDTVTRLQAARGAMDGFMGGFDRFTQARNSAEAMATALGSTAQGLENFSRQASSFGMNSSQMATAMDRVTQAILGQTAAGRQLRQVMQDYGVNFQGLSPSNADQALEQFIYNSQRYRTTQFSTQAMQTVLGPMNSQQVWELQQRDLESPYERRLRVQMEGLQRRVASVTQNAGEASHYYDQQRQLTQGYEQNYRIQQWYTPFRHPLSPNAGLTQAQTRDIMQRLHLSGDPYTRENELRIFQYAEQHPQEYGNARVWQWGDLGRDLFPMVAPGTFGAYAGNYGARLQRSLQGNESGFLNPLAWAQDIGSYARYYGRMGLLYGAWGTGQLGRMGPPPVIPVPERPLSPNDLYNLGRTEATGLAEQGFYGPAQFMSGQSLLLRLRQNETPDRSDLAKYYGAETGNELYNNAAYLAQQRRDLATQPGGSQILSGRMLQWLMGAPPEQRGQMQALLEFAQQNNIATAPWANGHMSLNDILENAGSGVGQLSLPQIRAFGRIRMLGDRNLAAQVSGNFRTFHAGQQQIRAAIPQGAGATEAATAYTQAYTEALAQLHDRAQATTLALNAQKQAFDENNTSMQKALQLVHDQAAASERNLSVLNMAGGAGASPVERLGAGITAGIETSVYNMRQAYGSNFTPGAEAAYRRRRSRGLAAEAQTFGLNAAGDAQYQVQIQQRLTAAAGAQADVQERLNSDIQVEKQFQQALAEAVVSGNQQAIAAIQQHMETVKQLNGEYLQLKETAQHLSFNRDLNFRVGLQQQRNGMTPQQQRRFDALSPVIQEYRNDPSLMGSPTAFMGNLGAGGSQYDSYFLQASAATGGRLSPEVMAVLAYREGSFQANPRQNIGGSLHRGMMQFDPATARTMGLIVDPTHHVDQRLDPTLAIPAAGAYLGRIMDRLGIRGPVTDLATLHRILGGGGYGSSFDPTVDALYGTALQSPDTNMAAVVHRLMTGNVSGPASAGIAAGVSGQNAAETDQAQRAAWQGGYAQQRLLAAILAARAGTGHLGQRLAQDSVPNPMLPTALQRVVAQNAQAADLGQFGLNLAQQGATLQQTAQDVKGLADAYSQGTLAGEAFQRAIANNDLIAQLKAQEEVTPQAKAQLEAYIATLQRYNQEVEKNHKGQVVADFTKHAAELNDQNQVTRAGMAAGPLASPEAVSLAQARVSAQQLSEQSGGRISLQDAYNQQAQQIYLKDQVTQIQQVRQGFQQMGSDAMDAFNSAVVGSSRLHFALYQITKDIEGLALKTLVEQPLLNLLQHSVMDPLSSAIGGALGFGGSASSRGSGGSVGSNVANTAGNAAVSVASKSIFSSLFSDVGSFFMSMFAQGGVIDEYGRPSRYMASGGLIDRPTRIYAAGGTVMAGENAPEAILPLKRLPNGNLGVASGGSGGHTIIVQAPVTIQGGGGGGKGGAPMDPATSLMLQRHFEMVATKAMRNVMANEMRPGGDLYMAGARPG